MLQLYCQQQQKEVKLAEQTEIIITQIFPGSTF